jgi:predicted ATPase/DNA-binding SARP family transcriptional activator
MDRNIDSGTLLATAPAMRARLLGPWELTVGERVIPYRSWPGRSSRSLLLLLLGTPDHRLHRDQVLHFLWPEVSPAAALNALYKALHALRRTLEPGLKTGKSSAYIELAGDMIGLPPACDIWIDADAFEASITDAMTVAPAERRRLLRQAGELYRGDFLVDEPYADWPVMRREFLRQQRNQAAFSLAALDLDAGEPLAAVGVLEQVLASDSSIEEAYRALMRAYAAAGQRDEALKQFERCRTNLAEELGVEPHPETLALRAEIADASAIGTTFSPPKGGNPPFNNLPAPPAPIVGRATETDAIQTLLWRPEVRLVTLTGPGGVGKTRLALEAAAGLTGDFKDGVAFVPLAALRDPALVIPTIVQTLGLHEQPGRSPVEVLQGHLRERTLLLVLDNFEHVIEAAPAVAELLAWCPGLKVLVTSREHLRLRGEHEYRLGVLSLPRLDRLSRPAVFARSEAVALYLQSVRAHRPDFALTEVNARAVAKLCVRLDGLPLAIELAAARGRHVSPERLLDQLSHRLTALDGGPRDLPERHRTIRDTVAWSYDLLSDEEQIVFRRVAVFAGGADLDAVRALCGERAEAIVYDLVDKSLMQWAADGPPRVSMLETIREFGLEQLEQRGELQAIAHAHSDYILALAESASPRYHGPEGPAVLSQLDAEHDNIRAALAWNVKMGNVEASLRLAYAVWRYWWMRGHLSEGRSWLERILAVPGEASVAFRTKLLATAGYFARIQGDFERARAFGEEGLTLARFHGDTHGISGNLGVLALVAHDTLDYERAALLQSEALAIDRERGYDQGIAFGLYCLATTALATGDFRCASIQFEEALARWTERGDKWGIARALGGIGRLANMRGDAIAAAAALSESLALSQNIGDKEWMVEGMTELAATAASIQPASAARLFGAEAALRAAIATPLAPVDRARYDRALAEIQARLTLDEFSAAWNEGQALSMEQAIASAMNLSLAGAGQTAA